MEPSHGLGGDPNNFLNVPPSACITSYYVVVLLLGQEGAEFRMGFRPSGDCLQATAVYDITIYDSRANARCD